MRCSRTSCLAVGALFLLACSGGDKAQESGHVPTGTCGTARPDLPTTIKGAEGLVIGPDGTIYFSQPFSGANANFIGRFRPPYDQPPELAWADMKANAFGIILDPKRKVIYAGSRTAAKVLQVTLADPPVVTELADASAAINGVTLGEDGAVYYTDQTEGHVHRVTSDGKNQVVTTSTIDQPNGIAFGPDGNLYVLQYVSGAVTQLTLAAGVETARVDRFATVPAKNADGLAFDRSGRLFVTASSTLYEVSADGTSVIAHGAAGSANVEFGAGALDCRDIYSVGSGIRRYQHDTPGLDVPWHRP